MYTCIAFHTASVFESDLASGYWQLVNEPALGKNYLAGAGFESNGTGMFSLFNTTLTSKIPTGAITAGAASITTFNTTSSGALAGGYSLQTAIGSGTITAGHGFISNNMTVAPEDKAKVMQVSFSYSATTGSSLMNFSGTSSNTWAVYIYDNANSAWIQPAGVYNMVQGSGVGKCTATFQTPSNATTVRVAIICITANTSGAVAMLWDSFYFGPQSVSYGPAMSDAKLYTPTLSTATGSITNTTTSAYWMQVGQNIKVNGQITFSAASAAFTTLYVSLPSGFSVNDSAIASSNQIFCGIVRFGDTGVNNYLGVVRYVKSSAKIELVSTVTNTSDAGSSADPAVQTAISNTTPFTYNSGDIIDFSFELPIVGWSSNSVMSADTDTRVVALSRASGAQISVPNTTYTYVDFTSAYVDTHSAWRSGVGYSAGSWTTAPAYVVPVSGTYSISCGFFFGPSNGSKQVLISKNGASIGNGANDGTTTSGANINASAIQNFVAGDLIQVQIWQNSGAAVLEPGSVTAAWSHLEIQRLSGPATIAATETVSAKYVSNSASSMTNDIATRIDFAQKSWDTHSAVTPTVGGWKFVAPVSGIYQISSGIIINVTLANTVAFSMDMSLEKIAISGSSTVDTKMSRIDTFGTGNSFPGISGTVTIRLLAGEGCRITAKQTSGATRSTTGSSTENYVTVDRIGN
jgi:hypothetical protein